MEKISSILPASPRVQSVDLDEAPPARPGAPAFGRKQGRNTVQDRITLSQKAKEMAAQDTMMVRNPKEAARAQKVEELNKRFFETRLQKPEVAPAGPRTEEIVQDLNEAIETSTADIGRARENVSQYQAEMAEPLKAQNLSVEA